MPTKTTRNSLKYDIRQSVKPTIAPLAAAISGALAASSLQAATITVDTLADGFPSGECSLRAALYSATTNDSFAGCIAGDSGEDTIVFDSSLSGTIFLDADQAAYDDSSLLIGDDVMVHGDERITVQGTGDAPAIRVKYGAESVDLRGLTITGGGGDRGGAIRSEAKELTLRNCTLSDNQAGERGGAISFEYAGSGIGRLRLFESTISQNATTGSNSRGGAIYMASDTASLRLYGVDISDNAAVGSGGAIELRTETGSVFARPHVSTPSTIEGNTAKYGSGGAINIVSNGGYGVAMTIRDSVISANLATSDGGAIAFLDNGTGQNGFGQLILEGVQFQDNNAGGDGGAVWFSRGDGAGTLAEPVNELTISDYGGQPTVFSNNIAAYGSAGLYASVGDAVPVTVENSDFNANVAYDGSGGGAVILAGNAGIAIASTDFTSNRAEGGSGGGLIAITSNSGDIQASNLSLIGNEADLNAGGLQVDTDGGDVGLEYSFISGNNALSGYGGGLQVYGTPGQFGIGYSILTGNTASSNGGAMDLYVPGTSSAQLEIKYSEVSFNQSGGSGGGMSLSAGSGSQFFFKNSTASANQAGSNGGAINAYNGLTLAMKYSTIANNQADGEGGVFTNLADGNCYASNSILAGNTAGPEDEGQDLRSANSYYCDADHSLIAGKYSQFNNGTGNVLFQDPLLQPLSDNGGAAGTWTHALDPASPAVDAANAGTFAPDTDQRGSGFQRIAGPALDMGAYELPLADEIFSDRFESP